MKVCVIGGGNIGTLLAAEFARKGFETVIHTSRPEKWSDTLKVLNPDDSVWFETRNFRVTASLEDAVENAAQIWVVLPSFMFPKIAKELLPLVKAGQMIMCVPGSGGAEFSFAPHIEKGCILCGLQRVHSIARLEKYGHAVYMLGRKPNLQLAAIPADKAQHYSEIVGGMLDLPCEALPNYLVVTLTPSNPILHTTRIYSMFKDYRKGDSFDHNILFYEEWTDEASELMIDCDAELQEICRKLDRLDLSMVKSLKIHYESDTVEKMTAKISGIPAFKGLTSPMKEKEPGVWVPDFGSRYFTADFPFGLKVILDTGRLVGADVKNIEKVWDWYLEVCNEGNNAIFSMPVSDLEEFYKIYLG